MVKQTALNRKLLISINLKKIGFRSSESKDRSDTLNHAIALLLMITMAGNNCLVRIGQMRHI